jgi:hypothetical protein
MKARTQIQKCTMELRSRQNTPINLTSGERLRQLKLIVYFLKTRTSRHFFQQLQITKYLLYALSKVEQIATCKTIIRE